MDFLNLPRYDVTSTTDPVLKELYQLSNEQNERLEWFFLDIETDPDHKAMKLEFIKPRQHRAKSKRRSSVERKRAEQAADERGYKNFLKEEGLTDLL